MTAAMRTLGGLIAVAPLRRLRVVWRGGWCRCCRCRSRSGSSCACWRRAWNLTAGFLVHPRLDEVVVQEGTDVRVGGEFVITVGESVALVGIDVVANLDSSLPQPVHDLVGFCPRHARVMRA